MENKQRDCNKEINKKYKNQYKKIKLQYKFGLCIIRKVKDKENNFPM